MVHNSSQQTQNSFELFCLANLGPCHVVDFNFKEGANGGHSNESLNFRFVAEQFNLTEWGRKMAMRRITLMVRMSV